MNLWHQFTLERAERRLDELIDLCQPRGPLADQDRHLVADVSRKAKLLKTALAKLLPQQSEGKVNRAGS